MQQLLQEQPCSLLLTHAYPPAYDTSQPAGIQDLDSLPKLLSSENPSYWYPPLWFYTHNCSSFIVKLVLVFFYQYKDCIKKASELFQVRRF